jgi:hypothetical protein
LCTFLCFVFLFIFLLSFQFNILYHFPGSFRRQFCFLFIAVPHELAAKMGKRKQSQTEDEVKGVQTENVEGATPRKRRLAKRTNRGRVGTSPLAVLNDDCLLHVLSFIGGQEQLLQQRAVSRHWGSLASSDPLWRPHFLRTFGPRVFGICPSSPSYIASPSSLGTP